MHEPRVFSRRAAAQVAELISQCTEHTEEAFDIRKIERFTEVRPKAEDQVLQLAMGFTGTEGKSKARNPETYRFAP